MKSFIVFALVVAAAVAAPAGPDADAVVVRNENNNIGVDGFSAAYETSNGISAQQQGELRQVPGAEQPALVIRGSYAYPGPDGVLYTVTYIADENGFQPQGAHLPVPPQV